jgi:hypothetical protein
MYEVLEAAQARLINIIEQSQRETASRLNALQTQMIGIDQHISTVYESISGIDARLLRLEQRLNIIGEPAE